MIDWGTLDPTAFQRALDAGLGRALLYVRQRGAVPDPDALWHACITCQTYDWDLEGHRADWLWMLMQDAGLTSRWADSLLASLPEATTIPDADQRAGLMLWLARAGHEGAPAALEALLSRNLDPARALPGARELIQLSGTEGMRTVLGVVSKAIADGDDRYQEGLGWWMMEAEDLLGMDVVAEVLASEPAARVVHDLWHEDDDSAEVTPPSRGPTPLSDSEREHLFTTVRRCAVAFSAGQPLPLDTEDLARALARLRRHPPVLLDPMLLALDAHPDAEVRRHLSRLLAGIRDPLLRALALQGPLGHPDRLRYLVTNFEPGDAGRIQAALDVPLPAPAGHDRCAILLRLHESRLEEDWSGCLMHVYTEAPSSLHREEALVRMIDDELAPPWLVAEACWDAHPLVADVAREAEPA